MGSFSYYIIYSTQRKLTQKRTHKRKHEEPSWLPPRFACLPLQFEWTDMRCKESFVITLSQLHNLNRMGFLQRRKLLFQVQHLQMFKTINFQKSTFLAHQHLLQILTFAFIQTFYRYLSIVEYSLRKSHNMKGTVSVQSGPTSFPHGSFLIPLVCSYLDAHGSDLMHFLKFT